MKVTAVFHTKYAVPLLHQKIRKHLEKLLLDESKQRRFSLLAKSITENTVTLTLDLPLAVSPHNAIAGLKKATASVLKRHYAELRTRVPSLWTRRYLVVPYPQTPRAAALKALLEEELR